MNDVINELQDFRHLKWEKVRKSSGTAGSFLKAYDDTGKTKLYYKLSDYDVVQGIVGHECFNEIIAQRLLRLFEIPHLEYRLCHALITIEHKEMETFLCESDDFKKTNESKIALEDYYAAECYEMESPLAFCERMGWLEYIHAMLTVDFLILNRDRHGANMEVLFNRGNKTVRLAPLFDHGLSLICRCHNEEDVRNFNVMEDLKVQSFVGTSSAFENIRLVPKEYMLGLRSLKEEDKEDILSCLTNALAPVYLDKIWEMIMRRWEYLDDLRNS